MTTQEDDRMLQKAMTEVKQKCLNCKKVAYGRINHVESKQGAA